MVSDPIPNPDVGVYSVWPCRVRLAQQSHGTQQGHCVCMRGGGGGGGGGGVCHIPHRIGVKLLDTIQVCAPHNLVDEV